MGVWGDGLYSGDFATDLRTTICAITRLPFDGDRLVQILSDTEPGPAHNPNDPDYSIFWLVVADQFAKRGISNARTLENALAVIDQGTDLAIHKSLGMPEPRLARRQKMLLAVRERISNPLAPSKPRTTLKKPQPLLMVLGDVLIYPTSNGHCINSYFSAKEKIPGWKQDGWGAAIIIECGRAFEFLAWYRPLTLVSAVKEKPTTAALQSFAPWVSRRPGTCSTVHFKRMELEKIAKLGLSSEKLRCIFHETRPVPYQAINDISIANELGIGPGSLGWLQTGGKNPLPAARRPEYIAIPDLGSLVGG
jgi:hypothetical protein